ncbi:MAG: hypothetical protein ACYDH6_17545 [Acidimicrobiales bacterium]
MPWCDDCARFWNPPSLRDGACPTCGATLEESAPAQSVAAARAPWHFKLLLVALVLYLGYRAYQGVFWVAHLF